MPALQVCTYWTKQASIEQAVDDVPYQSIGDRYQIGIGPDAVPAVTRGRRIQAVRSIVDVVPAPVVAARQPRADAVTHVGVVAWGVITSGVVATTREMAAVVESVMAVRNAVAVPDDVATIVITVVAIIQAVPVV